MNGIPFIEPEMITSCLLTRVGFIAFLLATFFGVMPSTALFVYIGSLGQMIHETGILQWVLVIVGLFITLWVAIYINQCTQIAMVNRSVAS